MVRTSLLHDTLVLLDSIDDYQGNLGIAILSGILSSAANAESSHSRSSPTAEEGLPEEIPQRVPTHFLACCTRDASAKRIRTELQYLTKNLTVLIRENVRAAREADVIMLGCKPFQLSTVLQEPGMREALEGKLLISILAGVPVSQIEKVLYDQDSLPDSSMDRGCKVVRVMPNTAALIQESMTVIATSDPPLPSDLSALVTWIFTRIGRVVHLSPDKMDASTALCGSGPATFALILEAITDGAVAMGLPRAEAQIMAAQTMRGCSGLVLNGEHPAILKDKVSTPGGCTIGGLMVLEEGRVRGTIARSVREATVVASQLGKGVQGVNGTRW